MIQLALPDGRFAYGRGLKTASVAFYSTTTDEPGRPTIGDRDFEFVVGVDDDVLRAEDVPIVGMDASAGPDDDWPPRYLVCDVLTGKGSIYRRGVIAEATEAEVEGLEPAAVWDRNHLIERLIGGVEV